MPGERVAPLMGRDPQDLGEPFRAGRGQKVAEGIVKALAEKFKTEEYKEFLKEGRWYTYLLGKASKTLSKNWVIGF